MDGTTASAGRTIVRVLRGRYHRQLYRGDQKGGGCKGQGRGSGSGVRVPGRDGSEAVERDGRTEVDIEGSDEAEIRRLAEAIARAPAAERVAILSHLAQPGTRGLAPLHLASARGHAAVAAALVRIGASPDWPAEVATREQGWASAQVLPDARQEPPGVAEAELASSEARKEASGTVEPDASIATAEMEAATMSEATGLTAEEQSALARLLVGGDAGDGDNAPGGGVRPHSVHAVVPVTALTLARSAAVLHALGGEPGVARLATWLIRTPPHLPGSTALRSAAPPRLPRRCRALRRVAWLAEATLDVDELEHLGWRGVPSEPSLDSVPAQPRRLVPLLVRAVDAEAREVHVVPAAAGSGPKGGREWKRARAHVFVSRAAVSAVLPLGLERNGVRLKECLDNDPDSVELFAQLR